jgi:hypothetical protein
LRAVLEDDVVLGVTALELERDFFVEVVLRILGFPVAKGHSEFVQQCAVDETCVLRRAVEFVLGDEGQVVLAAPAFQQVLERFAHHGFTVRAANLLQAVEFTQVLIDEYLAHWRRAFFCAGAGLRAAASSIAPSCISGSVAGTRTRPAKRPRSTTVVSEVRLRGGAVMACRRWLRAS